MDMVLHTVKAGKAQPKADGIEPRIAAAFGILDWTADEQAAWLAENGSQSVADQLAALNAIIDERNNKEAA